MQQQCRLVLPGATCGELFLALPVAGLGPLRAAAERHFGAELQGKDFVITDTLKVFDSDDDAAGLRDGATLVLASAADCALAAPARERISFQPHPKTLTMAGEFEYFAAQGRHPFVYALAEFVDNSLRATRRNAPRPRSITLSLVVSGNNPSTARGLVAIQDNGCGMNKHELADWAVMNLSMEERGNAPQEPQPAGRGGGGGAAATGAGRFLTGDLSFFGVGSKNAGFFMGSSIKVATRKEGEPYVHELGLAAADLEQRYHNREEVYVEDMVHRNPADPSTLSPAEQPFNAARAWVAAEGEEAGAAGESGGGTGPSFTRVVIGDLKSDVLRQIMDDEQGTHICQELAHLYHYYLHGEQGNRAAGGSKAVREGRLPNGEPFPDIVLQYQVDSRTVWRQRLSEVEDDMETKLLRAQQAELPFSLQVPDKGTVCGVLYYYPFQNDQETVPVENPLTSAKPATSPLGPGGKGRGRQMPGAGPSQLPPRLTQAPPRGGGTQLPAGAAAAAGGAAAMDDDVDEDAQAEWQTTPIFEAFWQGRLIPGARIDTLPFLEAVRQKRTAQGKDIIPDEAFRRLRGALFFGPAFRVTRNKLLFRDNLGEALAAAVPGERQMEAKFRQWLQRCHATLDKSVRFEALADSRTQAALRGKVGEEATAFERISDGARAICRGDVVHVNAKPQMVGRVLHFSIPQSVREEGSYANGRVHVELLPAEVYGPACEKQFSLRRLGAVLTGAEVEEHLQKEMLKVASSLRVEPMRFATGQALEFTAGDTISEVAVSVLNGGGQRILKTPFTNERLVVTQRLWRLPAPSEGQPAGEEEEAAAAGRGRGKRQRKGKKGKGRQDENADPGGNAAGGGAAAGVADGNGGLPAGAELLLSVENKTPAKEVFQFARISDGLQRSGSYALEFVAAPAAPGQAPLRAVVQLAVAPGPACSFNISGEGAAVAAVKDFALGEMLPPLKVTFSDRFGNPVAMQPMQTPPSLTISAAVAGPQGDPQECSELEVAAQQCCFEDGLLISGLRLLGSAAAVAGEPAGLQLLAGGDGLSHPTARQAQAPPSKQCLPTAEVQLCISMQGAPDLKPVMLPLRVRAGAPHALQLLPGNPWDEAGGAGAEQAAPVLQHGASLPPFQVAVFDVWGNPTAPSADLGFAVLAECGATRPQAQEFTPGALGIATLEGLVAAGCAVAAGPSHLRLSLKSYPATANTEAAVEAADPTRALALPLEVEPSVLPVGIQLQRNGQPLPTRQVQGEDGITTVTVLEGVPAGSSVAGLRMILVDGSGAPAAPGVAGKMTLSWKSGSKKAMWEGESLKIPAFSAPNAVGQAAEDEWVRFTATDDSIGVLETGVQLQMVPAEPAAWKLDLVDQLTSQHAGELGEVQCGETFALEVAAWDAFGNRNGGDGAPLPVPKLLFESSGPLQYNEDEWEQGWAMRGGEQVYSVRMALWGHPGQVRITATDELGEGGVPLLTPDQVPVSLHAGPAAQLSVEGPATLEVGTQAAIPQLRVRVCDATGNPTSSETFEVSLNSSALATDGSGRAASVSVSGGNKVKVKKGSAMFKDVRVTAEEAGSYALRVQSASRKVAVQDAVLHLVMQPLNAVTDLRVLLPDVLAGGQCQAGGSAELHVALLTENGLPLPLEVAAGSLTLKVTPPGGGRSDVVGYTLPAEAGEEGLQTEEGHYAFPLAELTAAGAYSTVAEYVETRPELAAGLSKKDATRRSASVQFQVHPGQPVALSLEAASLPEKLAVTNGGNSKQRLMLRNAAVQLQDCYGNASTGGGVKVRCRLRLLPGAAADSSSELPDLHVAQGDAAQETDEQGRAFLGDLSIAEGSGRATSGALECELVCEALGLYPSSAHELEMDGDGWAVCWSCPVLFSDDAARFAHIERLNQQRGELVQRRDELHQRLGGAERALAGAQQEQQNMQTVLSSKERGLGGPAPTSLRAAEKQLAAARRQAEAAAGAEPADAVQARYGNPKHPATASIDRVLQSGDAGLVGVFAQLGTVDDHELSAVLAAHFRGLLSTVVVQDAPTRQRLAQMLKQKNYPAPDVLALTNVIAGGARAGETPGFGGAGERAHALQRAACRGCDPSLATALPHTAGISKMRDKAAAESLGMSATDWPQGCLGYAFNLVRPAHTGHRASILANLLGGTLVFERLQEAEAYREFLTQKVRCGAGTILCLDGGRITSNGVVSGASFTVLPLDKADHRFGSSGLLGEDPAAAQAAEQVSLLEEWVGLLQARDEADAAAARAQAQAQAAEGECRGEVEQVEDEIAELDAQLALGDMAGAAGSAGAGGAGGQSGRKKRGRRQPQEEEGVQEEEEQQEQPEEEDARSTGKAKRRRMQRSRA